MKDIVVVGSFMMDLVTSCQRIPKEGETLVGQKFERNAGGKGANQAATLARLGKEVSFIAMVGQDEFGNEAKKILAAEGIDIKHVYSTEEAATGVGSVWLNEQGDNRIIVVPGANHVLATEHFDQVKAEIAAAKLVILQLELTSAITVDVINHAKEAGVAILLNPAPARALSSELLNGIDYLTPNESELASLTNLPVTTKEEAVRAATVLIEQGVKNVIVTLGEKGAIWLDDTLSLYEVNGHQVKAIDTVAAGDSFNGALAYGIIEGQNKKEVLTFANRVGALTVTKAGAIKSLPTMEEVINFTT